MANSEVLELVPRMRIDFNLLPVNGQVSYDYSSIETFITLTIKKLVGNNERIYVHLDPTHRRELTGFPQLRKHEKQLNQVTYGDPGFFLVRDLTFVDRFPGNEWDQRFYNARQFIVQEMHCKECNGQLLLTHLNPHPSEDPLHLINLISEGSIPTVILKGIPYRGFVDEPSTLDKLSDLFHSLGQLRDFRIWMGNVSIEFEDYEECCKVIKKLCSHSLKKNGNSSITADYDLTLEDSSSQDIVVGYNKSPTSQAPNSQMAMLEKELKTIKAIAEKNGCNCYNYSIREPLTIHVMKRRVAILEEEISTLKHLIARSGVGDNCRGDNESPTTQVHQVATPEEESNTLKATTQVHQVAILEEELNTLKAVLEESSVNYTETPATQALKRQVDKLEHRVTMLERENKRMKT